MEEITVHEVREKLWCRNFEIAELNKNIFSFSFHIHTVESTLLFCY